MIETNSIKAWYLAARPKTLTAAAVPVLLGIALAYKDAQQIQTLPALLCLLFAWVMQIDSNLVNDYFDFKHGNDDETRLGPKRACAEGWITLGAMKWGIILTTLLGCAIGLPLVLFGAPGPQAEAQSRPAARTMASPGLMGDRPRVELFARQTPPGWDVWGN